MSRFAAMSARQRMWIIGATFAGAVLVLIGYFGLIGPQRSDTASIESRVAETASANSALRARIVALQAQNQRLATYQAQARAAMAALPTTSGMPAFLRTLQALGVRTHTDAVNVTVGAPVDVTATATGAAPASTTATSSTGTASPATNTATPAAAPPVAPAQQVFSLPLTVQVNGSPTALGQFLTALQGSQPRAVLITQIIQGSGTGTTSGTTGSGGSNLQLTMQAFVAPGAAGVK